ncbi:MAG: hypothetical protein H6Q25_1639 [Bacteroidetes bacterium]|nr:hypothetical protein [Bacteroidota bacterium]
MNQSKRHHYLPRFYLKGFTNKDGDFFIYDKKKDEIRKSKPDNSFFEKYRNTGTVKEEKSDLPEQVLAEFDNRSANVLEKIRNSNFRQNILTPEILYEIRFFIASTFWRIPQTDNLREKIIDDFSFQELGFGIFNKKSGERMEEAEQTLKDIDLFRKMYSSLLPLVSFMGKYKTQNFNDWRIIHRTNSIHITGDNPLILRDKYENFSSIQQNIIMPLSSQKILACTNKAPDSFDPVFNLKMDIMILHQSDRFVCSSSEEYLKLLIDKPYKMTIGRNWEERILNEIFSYFD